MIEGLRDPASEPELFARQIGFILARLAFRSHILAQAIHALYLFKAPKSDEERANARLSLETALAEAEDPGRVMAWAAEHPELLPTSMK